MKIGVLGVGALAEYLIRGVLSDAAGDWHLGGGNGVEFLLSPRSEERVARLGLPVAGSNQEVVDGCDAVLVCLPASAGIGVLKGLRFRAEQTVCSAMAGVGLEALAEAVAPARACVAMMPGYANAYGLGPSALYPADPFWAGVLSRVGPVHEMGTAEEFETAAVFGAMSGASVAFLQHLAGWFAARGLEPGLARRLVAETLRGNAEVLLRSEESLEAIVAGVATPGGITEQLVAGLQERGALAAWDEGMDAVLARMTGRIEGRRA